MLETENINIKTSKLQRHIYRFLERLGKKTTKYQNHKEWREASKIYLNQLAKHYCNKTNQDFLKT